MEDELEFSKNQKTPKQKGAKIYKSNKIFDIQNNKSSSKEVYRDTNVRRDSISSFHTQKATSHSSEHMKRESKVTYLLNHDCKENEYKKYDDMEEFKSQAEKIYKEKIGQKMQSKAKANLIKEAVLNTKSTTTISDIENTFKALNKKLGGHYPLEISIHRDEGVFLDTKYDIKDLEYTAKTLTWRNIKLDTDVTNEVIDYAPNRNIFYNEKNKNWYLDKQFENKADVTKFQKWINYHAHVIYTNFDKETGKTARLDRKDFREAQSIVADSLGMKRGEEFSKNKRMTHWQLKKAHDNKRDIKIKNLVKQRDLQAEMKILREELKERKAPRKDYSKLEQVNKELKEQIRNKELVSDDLKKTISDKIDTIDYQNKLLDKKDITIQTYKEQDNHRELNINGSITKERLIVKQGLLKTKEIFVYNNESVEKYIEVSKHKEEQLTSENLNLKDKVKELTKKIRENLPIRKEQIRNNELDKER